MTTTNASPLHASWSLPISPSTRTAAAPPRPRIVEVLAFLAGLGGGAALALAQGVESWSALHSPGGYLLAVSRYSAVLGTYLLVIMIALTVRLPWLERTVGQDTLVRWHRQVAPWAVSLVSLHVVSAVWGYAQQLRNTIWQQIVTFILHYPDMLQATVSFGLLLVVAFSSIRAARSRMRYQTWWTIHVYAYLAMGLAFMHQIRTGVMFVGHPLRTTLWTGAWIVVGVAIVAARWAAPVWHNLRWQLRVVGVEEVAPSTFAVIMQGRHLETLAVDGGQFFQWRFAARDLLWQSHPYSLSSLPRPPFVRITVKALGEHSRKVAALRPGTRVIAEGPYGVFTHRRARTAHRVLLGAGIGITPIRAMLDDAPADSRITVIVRAVTVLDIAHRDEMKSLVAQHGGDYHEVIGTPNEVNFSAALLASLVPDIASSDLYLCGPPGFTDVALACASQLGLPPERVHYEAFTF